jgi:hypothetical protein
MYKYEIRIKIFRENYVYKYEINIKIFKENYTRINMKFVIKYLEKILYV